MHMPHSESRSGHCLPATALPDLHRSGIVQKRKSCLPLRHLFPDSNLSTNALLPPTPSGSGSTLTYTMFLQC